MKSYEHMKTQHVEVLIVHSWCRLFDPIRIDVNRHRAARSIKETILKRVSRLHV